MDTIISRKAYGDLGVSLFYIYLLNTRHINKLLTESGLARGKGSRDK